MTLLVSWLVFPLLLGAVSLGLGLLLEQLAGSRLPDPLLLPAGLAALIVVSSLAVSLPATARFATPLVAALAVGGFVVGRPRFDRCAVAAAVVVFLFYGAPVLASGAPTIAGYIKLDDTATFLALTDRVMEHGRSLAGLAPSSYEATLAVNLAHGYPLGSLLPLGVGHELVRTDVAWLFQPWLAFCAAMLALCLYQLAVPLIERRWLRALAACVAAQPALLYGVALWGGVKELTAAALIATAAALTAMIGTPRSLVPWAVTCAAVLDTLSAAGILWLLPLALPLVLMLRRKPGAVVAGLALAAALAAPAVVAAWEFLRASNRAVFDSAGELGNLIRPLRPVQIVGIWPSGDFRLDPDARLVAVVLIGLAVAAAVVGVLFALERRAVGLLLALASVLTGAIVCVGFGAPWIGGKALALGSPFVLLTALAGCVALATMLRPARLAFALGGLAALALTVGVAWSNALAYRDVNLAPYSQLAELEQIGERFAGDGPALMTEYQPYGVRHFLRRLDAEGVSELRRRTIPLRDGRLAGKGEYVDLDRLQLGGLLAYRTFVLRRSPTASRPPAPYRPVWAGRWYEVWQRDGSALPLAHLPLGDVLAPGATPSCGDVRRLGTLGRLTAPRRAQSLVWSLTDATLPAGWSALGGGAVLPGAGGAETLLLDVPRAGDYRVWVGGSVRGKLSAEVDGTRTGEVSRQLQNAGQWLDLGTARLPAGTSRVVLSVSLPALEPGTGSGGFPLGPLLLEPLAPSRLLEPSKPETLCGATLDWVEARAR